ncbi:MAG: (2Fe-2S) ferredoxin domain-containing protein [Alphaproteobacteria bacterium]|nr:(2Fe-2S) ferredoxin domain-containing protein [Alphaproteobacteria bacterium]
MFVYKSKPMFTKPPAPRDLNQPAKILVRENPTEGGAILVTCCVNVRRDPLVCCSRRGSKNVVALLRKGLTKRRLRAKIQTSGCLGPCNDGPNIRIEPSNSWVFGARVEDVPLILDTIGALCPNEGTSS